jgi:DNA-binding transcriptional MocR family regulator
LEWACSAGAWIIEDDYDSEYRYESLPIAVSSAEWPSYQRWQNDVAAVRQMPNPDGEPRQILDH